MKISTLHRRKPARLVAAVSTVLVVGLMAAGCSSATAGADGASTTTTKGTTLTYYNDNPQDASKNQAYSDKIEKLTGYPVDYVASPSTDAFKTTVLSSIGTTKSGDLVKWWSGKALQGLAATGNLEDLTPVWDEAVKNGDISDDLRDAYSYKGKVYAMPTLASYWVAWYSKDIFKQAGIDAPPTTLAELDDDMAKIKAIGVTPMCTGQSEGWTSFVPFQMLLGEYSPDTYADLMENKAKFDDPKVKQALAEWKKWIDNGWTTAPDQKTFDCPAAMKAGKVAIQPLASWGNGLMKTAGLTPEEYGAFIPPSAVAGQAPAVFVEGGAIVVPKNAPHKDAALKVAASMVTTDYQQLPEAEQNDLTVNPKVVIYDPVLKDLAAQIEAQKPQQLIRYYEGLPPTLVTSTLSSLGGFMVTPDIQSLVSQLTDQAKQEWADWDKNPTIG